ncbi:MAG: hypothetical protein ACHQU1_02850 [Gemmatimonadales bacterium]
MTLRAQLPTRAFLVVASCLLGSACGNDSARAPNPTSYRWPDEFAYRLDYVADAQQRGQTIQHYAETRTMHFQIRDAQYFGASDSVAKTSQRPGGPLEVVAYEPEDTLGFYVSIGRHGEITRMQLACDPAVPACAAVLPSVVTLQLRRIIPRLPVWEAPRGSSWEDTLAYDDTSRPGGVRGALVTRYTGRRDTLVAGRWYWVIEWRSVRTASRPGEGAMAPIQEDGMSLVEKERLIPVFSVWAAVVVAPPELRAAGASGAGYRGRAYLTGSVFDSLYSRDIEH